LSIALSTGLYRATKIGEMYVEILPRVQRGFDRSIAAGMSHLGHQLTRNITLPLAAAGGAAVKMGADFEAEMRKIVGLVGVSREEVSEFSEVILREGAKWGQPPRDLAEAMFFVTSAGFRGAEALEILERSAKAASAGLGTTKDVADAVTSAMNAYGSENLSAAEATDILLMSVRAGKLEADDLASKIGKVIPVSSRLGVEFHEVGAAIAGMTRTGATASEVTTQLRQIFVALLRPSAQANEQLEDLGLSAQGLRTQLREKGLLSTLTTLRDAFGDNEEAIGRVFGNVRALVGVADLLGENFEDNVAIFDDLAEAAGVTDRAFGEVSDTVKHQFNVAFAELQTALIEVGQVLGPHAVEWLGRLRDILGDLLERFRDLSPEEQQRWLTLFAAMAGLGPAVFLVGKLVGFVGFLAANPKVAAILAISAALIKMVESSEELQDSFGGIWTAIFGHSPDSPIVAGAPGIGHDYAEATKKGLLPAINELVVAIGDLFDMDWESFGDAAADALGLIAEGIEELTHKIGVVTRLIEGDWQGAAEMLRGTDPPALPFSNRLTEGLDRTAEVWREHGFWAAMGDEWSRFWRKDLGLEDGGWLMRLLTGGASSWGAWLDGLGDDWSSFSHWIGGKWSHFWRKDLGLEDGGWFQWLITGGASSWGAWLQGIRDDWDRFTAWLGREWSGFWRNILGLGHGGWLNTAFTATVDWIGRQIDRLVDFFRGLPDRIRAAVRGAFDSIGEEFRRSTGNLFPGGFGSGVGGFVGGLIPGRASGGPVEKGHPYIVGEKRAELFVPNESGVILPRVPRLGAGGLMGGGQPLIIEVISYLDGEPVSRRARYEIDLFSSELVRELTAGE
jgi:TP901 family phage tail tape measure protein